MFVTGLVLAAGGSRRLGQPKQLLPYRGTTLLDHTLRRVRGFGFEQILVTLGGSADGIRSQVDLSGVGVVENSQYGTGCSSSISAAIPAVDDRAAGLMLLLGDQPGVSAEAVQTLRAVAGRSPIAVCRYDDGVGHPFWFRRDVFDELMGMHGDKGVWRLLESRDDADEVRTSGPVPVDVDTWEDYETLLDSESLGGRGALRRG